MKRYSFVMGLRTGAALLSVVNVGLCFSAEREEPGRVGSSPTNALTLEALVADTLANNPELNFYKAEIAAARGERQTAGAWSNPEVAGTAGSKRTTAGGIAGEGLAWSVSVKQTFEWAGRMPLRKTIANRQIRLAEL